MNPNTNGFQMDSNGREISQNMKFEGVVLGGGGIQIDRQRERERERKRERDT